jgi:hypothetical protein
MRSRRGGFCRSERGLHHPNLLVLPRAQRAARSRRSGYQTMDLQRMRSNPWSRPQRRHQHRPSRKRDARSSLAGKPLPSGRGGFTPRASAWRFPSSSSGSTTRWTLFGRESAHPAAAALVNLGPPGMATSQGERCGPTRGGSVTLVWWARCALPTPSYRTVPHVLLVIAEPHAGSLPTKVVCALDNGPANGRHRNSRGVKRENITLAAQFGVPVAPSSSNWRSPARHLSRSEE